jgi:translation initiation factor IF-3
VSTDVAINNQIRSPQVRLVDGDGNQIGVVPVREALDRARACDLDLVQISKGEPPVCRLLDAGRYLFERQKTEREAARRQRELAVETKEVQLRPAIDSNDLATKSRRAVAFLAEGDKVKIVMRFRGREQSHKGVGREIIDRFLTALGEYKIERPLTDAGNTMSMVVAPVRSKSELVRAGKP